MPSSSRDTSSGLDGRSGHAFTREEATPQNSSRLPQCVIVYNKDSRRYSSHTSFPDRGSPNMVQLSTLCSSGANVSLAPIHEQRSTSICYSLDPSQYSWFFNKDEEAGGWICFRPAFAVRTKTLSIPADVTPFGQDIILDETWRLGTMICPTVVSALSSELSNGRGVYHIRNTYGCRLTADGRSEMDYLHDAGSITDHRRCLDVIATDAATQKGYTEGLGPDWLPCGASAPTAGELLSAPLASYAPGEIYEFYLHKEGETVGYSAESLSRFRPAEEDTLRSGVHYIAVEALLTAKGHEYDGDGGPALYDAGVNLTIAKTDDTGYQNSDDELLASLKTVIDGWRRCNIARNILYDYNTFSRRAQAGRRDECLLRLNASLKDKFTEAASPPAGEDSSFSGRPLSRTRIPIADPEE